MTATFDPALGNAISRVRFNLGDTSVANAMLQDETINYFLVSQSMSEGDATAALARGLLVQYGAQPTSVRLPDGTSADFSERVKQWQAVVAQYDTTNTGLRIRRMARPQALGGGEYTP